MGELIEGIGDEVVFFGTFLVLSFFFVAFLATRGGRNRQPPSRQQGQPTDQSQAAQDRSEEVQSSSSSSPTPQDVSSQSENSELRSRFHQEEQSSQPEAVDRPSRGEEATSTELINIRLISSGSVMALQVRADSTLNDIRRSHFQQELEQNCPVRFIYQGRVLGDDSMTLQQLGITDDCAVHVHIGRPRSQDQQENQQQPGADFLDLSHLFVPLFGVILGIVWVTMLCYPHIFSFATKLFLFALSFGYVMLTYVTTFT